MTDQDQILSELLNAYLDGELDEDAVARLKRRLAGDPRARRHLHELEHARALTRAALASEPDAEPAPPRHKGWQRWSGYGLAAALLIGVGIGIDRWLQPAPTVDELLATLPSHAQIIRPADLDVAEARTERRAVFHVVSANPRSVRSTLEHVENLLRRHDEAGQLLRVEIVANANGLNALRADTTPAREQIARLHQAYPNLAFLACGTTMARLKREQGVDVRLLPQARVTSSALDQILLRLRQGWIYIRL